MSRLQNTARLRVCLGWNNSDQPFDPPTPVLLERKSSPQVYLWLSIRIGCLRSCRKGRDVKCTERVTSMNRAEPNDAGGRRVCQLGIGVRPPAAWAVTAGRQAAPRILQRAGRGVGCRPPGLPRGVRFLARRCNVEAGRPRVWVGRRR